MKRREHRVGPSLVGRDLTDVDHVRARMRRRLDAERGHHLPNPCRSAAGERADVIAEVKLRGTDLARQPRQLALWVAAAHDQPRAAVA